MFKNKTRNIRNLTEEDFFTWSYQCKDLPIDTFRNGYLIPEKHYLRRFTDSRLFVVNRLPFPPEIQNIIMEKVYLYEIILFLIKLETLWHLEENVRKQSIVSFYTNKTNLVPRKIEYRKTRMIIDLEIYRCYLSIGFATVALYQFNQKPAVLMINIFINHLKETYLGFQEEERTRKLLMFIHFSFIDLAISSDDFGLENFLQLNKRIV